MNDETIPSDEELKALYPTVDEFAAAMRRELWKNREHGDRPSWLVMTPKHVYFEIAWHLGKLTDPLRFEDDERIVEHAADIGNAAMFAFDIARSRP